MRILITYRIDSWRGTLVETYSLSFYRALLALLDKQADSVMTFGEGHALTFFEDVPMKDKYDLFIEIECGRNQKGKKVFHRPNIKTNIPSAVWFIDSHGNPDLHESIAKHYTHIFYAVWDKRDLFSKHPSAHFLPSATDLKWFGCENFKDIETEYQFGFFGSRGGLDRADPLKAICETNGWKHHIRQIGKPYRHHWPRTGRVMAACQNLFNCGQKHDINQRLFESMAAKRPLINDRDSRSGIDKLFEAGYHYLPYESYTYKGLEEQCKWALDNPKEAMVIAENAYNEVVNKHTVTHRVQSMLEILGVKL